MTTTRTGATVWCCSPPAAWSSASCGSRPPRFLPELGYIDLSTRYGFDLYGPVGTGVSDQFAAMPSIHVGWAAVVSFGIIAVTTAWWRWLFLGHVIITFLVVAATGNHWWLDGIVAIGLLVCGLAIDAAARRYRSIRRAEAAADAALEGDQADVVAAGPTDGLTGPAVRSYDAASRLRGSGTWHIGWDHAASR